MCLALMLVISQTMAGRPCGEADGDDPISAATESVDRILIFMVRPAS